MKVAICAIAKLENEYINEWIEYHLQIGIDTIYLYDNNQDSSIIPIVRKYIKTGKLVLLDVHNMQAMQMSVYHHYYKHFSRHFDWSAFIDCDEFLTISNEYKDFKEYLKSIPEPFNVIHLNWMCYGDNGYVYKTPGNVIDRFIHPCSYDFKCTRTFPENNKTKSIVKRGLNITWVTTVHSPDGRKIKVCNADGMEIANSPFSDYTFKNAYIRHYFTKSLEEWIITKQRRGRADARDNSYVFDRYTEYNPNTNIEVGLKEIIHCNNGQIIIFLTINRQQIKDIALIQNAIENGSVAPDKIIYNLPVNEFPNKENDIPQTIQDYLSSSSVIIHYGDKYIDNQSLIEIIRYSPTDVVIVIDDIHNYNKDSIKDQLLSYIAKKGTGTINPIFKLEYDFRVNNRPLDKKSKIKQLFISIIHWFIRKYSWMRGMVVIMKAWGIRQITLVE